jgi:hypothetical protein
VEAMGEGAAKAETKRRVKAASKMVGRKKTDANKQPFNTVDILRAIAVARRTEALLESKVQVRPNGELLSRRGRRLPAHGSGFDTHRDSITSRCDYMIVNLDRQA